MKILIVITSMQTGGAEKMVLDFVPRLVDHGHVVDVAIFSGEETDFLQLLRRQKCKLFVFGHSVYNPINIICLLRIMGMYDLVHTHLTYPQYYVAVANLFVRTKLVTTEHSTNNRRRGNKFFALIDRWMYRQYHKIICISAKAEENLRLFIQDTKSISICTIDNGVDVMAFHHATANSSLRKGSTRFVAIMVASFHWQKDQDTIIKAMSLLPKERFELWLVGVGNRRPILEKLVKEYHVEEQVVFWGGRTDIAQLLHTADVAIMSSHFEGLSLSSIEGMSVGHPFVSSDVDGLHDTVIGAGILFPHEDFQALSKIMLHLESDRQYYEEVSKKCFERAKKYDLAQTIEAYEQVYRSI